MLKQVPCLLLMTTSCCSKIFYQKLYHKSLLNLEMFCIYYRIHSTWINNGILTEFQSWFNIPCEYLKILTTLLVLNKLNNLPHPIWLWCVQIKNIKRDLWRGGRFLSSKYIYREIIPRQDKRLDGRRIISDIFGSPVFQYSGRKNHQTS